MPDAIEVRKVPLQSVADASGLATLIDDGVIEADRVVAVIGKTEGNGGVNDYTRIIADRAFREVLVAKGTRDAAAVREIPIVWSGGTDGVLSPHATVFATVPEAAAVRSDEPRLAVGYAMSEVLLPEDIGRSEMIRKVADAVQVAMKRAGITDAGRRALRANQDPASDHRHHPRGPIARPRRVHRGHAGVDGRLQRHDGAGYRGGPGRDRHAA